MVAMHVDDISLQEEDPDVIDGDEGEKLTVIGGPTGEDLLMSKYLGVMTSMASVSLPTVKNVSCNDLTGNLLLSNHCPPHSPRNLLTMFLYQDLSLPSHTHPDPPPLNL